MGFPAPPLPEGKKARHYPNSNYYRLYYSSIIFYYTLYFFYIHPFFPFVTGTNKAVTRYFK